MAALTENIGSPEDDKLTFHEVHGENVTLYEDKTLARRHFSFIDGVTFSARPIRDNEKIVMKFLEIGIQWTGGVCFGFTSTDPANNRTGLPSEAPREFGGISGSISGYWTKPLDDRFVKRGNVVYFYLDSSGVVHFGVNGKDEGEFLTGVKRAPGSLVWAVIDVYGRNTAIKLLDSTKIESGVIDFKDNFNLAVNDDFPELSFQPPDAKFQPLPFLQTPFVSNLHFRDEYTVTRASHAYAFSSRYLMYDEHLVIHTSSGHLSFGITSCNPNELTADDLARADLLERPDFWVVSTDLHLGPQSEIVIFMTRGTVKMSLNGKILNSVVDVDDNPKLKFWVFVDLHKAGEKVRMYTTMDDLLQDDDKHIF